jgi:hypothetical protein
MQDLSVAQKRYRPAYWFQHLDLVARTIPPIVHCPAASF